MPRKSNLRVVSAGTFAASGCAGFIITTSVSGSTAERTAERLGKTAAVADLYEPSVNLDLGVAHLAFLRDLYGGDIIKVLAAYNGGEAAVAKWEQRFGGVAEDEFVESITYRETRDYVKRVMSHYRHYREIYGQTAAAPR